MKKIILSVSAFMLTMNLMAQAPQKMSYQAVVRNSSNGLVQNGSIGMRISILQGSASGTAVYVETQTPTTNNNGLASVTIGSGTVVSGDMSTIDWSTGDYFLQTETDPTGGTNYTVTGTSQLLSVPYALHAKTAESVINDQVNDADADPTNELQNWSNLPGIPADFADNTDDVDDADADPANEIELPSGGNNAQVLSTDGSGNYSWVDQTLNNLPNGTVPGQTAYWNGTAWVLTTNLYNNGGNIGINTTNPTNAKLVVAGNPGETGLDLSSTDQYAHMRVISNPDGDNAMFIGLGSGTASQVHMYSNNNEVLTLNGGVGVGTTTPTQPLDVVGNVKFSGALMPANSAGTTGQVLTSTGAGSAPTWTTPAAATNIYNSNGTLTGNRVVTQGTNTLGFTGSSVNAFSVDGTTMSVDAQNNRVGIGTAAPTNDLHVAITTLGGGVTVSGPTPGYRLSPNAGASIAFGAANIANEWASGSAANDAVMVNQHATGKLILATGSAAAARMTVTPSGNVGIGTTAPSGALHVNGANGASSWTYIQGNTGAGGAGNPSPSITTGLMMGWNATNIGGESEIIFGSGGGTDPKLNFATWNGTTKTQIMSMNDNGNVGIGTINPNAPLQFASAVANRKIVMYENANNDHEYWGFGVNPSTLRYQVASTGGSHIFYAAASSTASNELMRVQGDGNVGIGTATPSTKLTVSGTTALGNNLLTVLDATNGHNVSIGSNPSGGSIGTINNSNFRLLSNNIERVIISNTGNVSIGTTNSFSKLNVSGSLQFTGGFTSPAGVIMEESGGSIINLSMNFREPNKSNTTKGGGVRVDGRSGFNTIQFYTRAAGSATEIEAMSITESSNVGIGTTSPARKLHVNAVMRLEPTTAPATPAKGDIYMDSTTNKLMVFDGTVWQACW